ncbi:MAG: sugar transferase [Hymenobacter sp.]
MPDYEGTLRKNVNIQYHDYGPILTVRRNPAGFARQPACRSGRLTWLFRAWLSWAIFPIIMPVLALLIKLDSPGPVFFKQLRPGKHNKLFPCYKLRTMRTDLSGTELQATKGDARVTRIGRFLRASSLDELPQFFNVWFGHMSVVGPRPNMQSQLEEYSKLIEHLRPPPHRDARHHGLRAGERLPGRNPRLGRHGKARGVRPEIRRKLVAAARCENHHQDGQKHDWRARRMLINRKGLLVDL